MTSSLRPTVLVLLALVSCTSTLVGCPAQPGGPFPSDGGGLGGSAGAGGAQDGDEPGVRIEESVGPDGCPVVALDPAQWAPLHGSYTGGVDPFFHLHTQEAVAFFGAELYTDYGPGWTGQTGTFAPSCGDNGICVYLVPDGTTVTRAEVGEVDVVSLSQSGGQLERPAEVVFRDMTFVGTESPDVCFHVEEVTLRLQ